MTFFATASGLMIERVRSTAMPRVPFGLKPDKFKKIQHYIMRKRSFRIARDGLSGAGAIPPRVGAQGSPGVWDWA
jgi:hypothetical protein